MKQIPACQHTAVSHNIVGLENADPTDASEPVHNQISDMCNLTPPDSDLTQIEEGRRILKIVRPDKPPARLSCSCHVYWPDDSWLPLVAYPYMTPRPLQAQMSFRV